MFYLEQKVLSKPSSRTAIALMLKENKGGLFQKLVFLKKALLCCLFYLKEPKATDPYLLCLSCRKEQKPFASSSFASSGSSWVSKVNALLLLWQALLFSSSVYFAPFSKKKKIACSAFLGSFR